MLEYTYIYILLYLYIYKMGEGKISSLNRMHIEYYLEILKYIEDTGTSEERAFGILLEMNKDRRSGQMPFDYVACS